MVLPTTAANLHRLRRCFSTSYTPWKPNLIHQGLFHWIHALLRKEYSEILRVIKVVPVPTTSLRNFLAKSQPNIASPSPFATDLREQRALDTETTFWSDNLDNIFSSSFSSSISLNSHIFMLKCFFCYLQDRTEDFNSSSGWGGLHYRPIFQIFTAAEYKIDTSCPPACSQRKVIAIFICNVQFVTFPFKSV